MNSISNETLHVLERNSKINLSTIKESDNSQIIECEGARIENK
jgi:hypothetical protein